MRTHENTDDINDIGDSDNTDDTDDYIPLMFFVSIFVVSICIHAAHATLDLWVDEIPS